MLRPRRLNYSFDYWYPSACVRLNLSEVNEHKSEEQYYINVKGSEITSSFGKPAFYLAVEGDRFKNYEVKYGNFEIDIIEVTSMTRLQSPFKSNCSNEEHGINIFPGPYTRNKCIDTLLFYKILAECGDVVDHLQKYIKPLYK